MTWRGKLDGLTGIYADVAQVSEVKRYVVTEAGIDEHAEFPNLIFKGWCKHPDGSTWKTEWCPWSVAVYPRLFTPHGWALIQTMRWEVQRGRYSDDMERWKA